MEQLSIIKRRIYDPFQRVLHWSIALACLFLLFTGLSAELVEFGSLRNQVWHWHIKAGYILIVALGLRLLWAIIGPRFAQIGDFLKYFYRHQTHKVLQKFTEFGHDPKAALLYLSLYALLIVMVITGLALAGIEHNLGPFAQFTFDRLYLREYFQTPHVVLSYFIILFSLVHIGALLWHQHQQKLPMWYAMFDGIQHRFKKNVKANEKPKQPEVKNA